MVYNNFLSSEMSHYGLLINDDSSRDILRFNWLRRSKWFFQDLYHATMQKINSDFSREKSKFLEQIFTWIKIKNCNQWKQISNFLLSDNFYLKLNLKWPCDCWILVKWGRLWCAENCRSPTKIREWLIELRQARSRFNKDP